MKKRAKIKELRKSLRKSEKRGAQWCKAYTKERDKVQLLGSLLLMTLSAKKAAKEQVPPEKPAGGPEAAPASP